MVGVQQRGAGAHEREVIKHNTPDKSLFSHRNRSTIGHLLGSLHSHTSRLRLFGLTSGFEAKRLQKNLFN